MIPDEILSEALEIAKSKNLAAAGVFLTAKGFLTFGVEYVECEGRELAYVNMGDSYETTVCKEANGYYFLGTWADWMETAEAEYCEDNEAIRCGYCGKFTADDADDWRDNVCSNCDNPVGG